MNCRDRPEARTAAEAITSRRSVRAFLPEPVPRETVRRILEIAGRAPSGSNIQPWHVDVVMGRTLTGLTTAITARFDAGDEGEETYQYIRPRGANPIWRGGGKLAEASIPHSALPGGTRRGCVRSSGGISCSSTGRWG